MTRIRTWWWGLSKTRRHGFVMAAMGFLLGIEVARLVMRDGWRSAVLGYVVVIGLVLLFTRGSTLLGKGYDRLVVGRGK